MTPSQKAPKTMATRSEHQAHALFAHRHDDHSHHAKEKRQLRPEQLGDSFGPRLRRGLLNQTEAKDVMAAREAAKRLPAPFPLPSWGIPTS